MYPSPLGVVNYDTLIYYRVSYLDPVDSRLSGGVFIEAPTFIFIIVIEIKVLLRIMPFNRKHNPIFNDNNILSPTL